MSNYAPKPKTKMLPCKHCGEPMEVGWKTKKLPWHITCAIQRASDAQIQISRRSGPYYEKWLEGMRRFADRTMPGGGGGHENVHRST